MPQFTIRLAVENMPPIHLNAERQFRDHVRPWEHSEIGVEFGILQGLYSFPSPNSKKAMST